MNGVYRRIAVLALALAAALPAGAAERILDYAVALQVRADASMQVTERIAVVAEGARIKRGIYRDFPTSYTGDNGTRFTVGFRVRSVRRWQAADAEHLGGVETGGAENFFIKPIANGERVYIGRENVLLEPGIHVYEIVYETDRQLGYFDDHDELYWNVTGNAWEFAIERASATVTLPAPVPADSVQVEAYTGPAGARGSDYSAEVDDDGRSHVLTTTVLAPGSGLTIVVSWAKGHVWEPTTEDRLAWFVGDNAGFLAGGGGLLLLLAWYCIAWLIAGRDPEAGPLVPRYAPPAGCSPGAVRHVWVMGYDAKTFAAALINLAVGGHIVINEAAGRAFDIKRVAGEKTGKPAPGERSLLLTLLHGPASIELAQKNHERIAAAMRAHEVALRRDYGRHYFARNTGVVAVGVVVSLLSLVAALWLQPRLSIDGPVGMVMLFGVLGVLVIGYQLLFGLARLWGHIRAGTRNTARVLLGMVAGIGASALVLSGFTAVLLSSADVPVFETLSRIDATHVALVLFITVLLLVNAVFHWLMKAPTRLGQRLLDEVEGLREYLTIAEADEIRLIGAPDKTPEHYERLLPYAVALDCEHEWSERFRAVIERAVASGDYERPSWYSGESWDPARPASFTAAVGSALASVTSAASVAPGSSGGSSGSGGGGSSGGGGGGGGGGGW